MGFIQPGTGYNFVNSEDGAALEILFPEVEPYGPEQFKVVMDGDKVSVAMGRVVGQQLSAAPDSGLSEFDVRGFAVFPTDKLTEGTDATSVWCSQGGNVEIEKFTAAEGENPSTGSNLWGVYLIRNQGNYGDVGPVVMPFLAVMANGSEAENYSTPWAAGIREYHLIRQKASVEITQPNDVVYGGLLISQAMAIKRYNCQRLRIADLQYTDGLGWKVTQYLIGTLYMPNNVVYKSELEYEQGDAAPNVDWPLNEAENESWSDPWADYTKNFNSGGLTKTNDIPV